MHCISIPEAKISSKYNRLSSSYSFPIAIESLGALGSISRSFIKSLGRRISQYTGDELAGHYLLQRLFVTVQRGTCPLLWTLCHLLSLSSYVVFVCFVLLFCFVFIIIIIIFIIVIIIIT